MKLLVSLLFLVSSLFGQILPLKKQAVPFPDSLKQSKRIQNIQINDTNTTDLKPFFALPKRFLPIADYQSNISDWFEFNLFGRHRKNYKAPLGLFPNQLDYQFNAVSLNDHFSGNVQQNLINKNHVEFAYENGLITQTESYRSGHIAPYTNFHLYDYEFSSSRLDISYRQRVAEGQSIYIGVHNTEIQSGEINGTIKQPQVRMGYKMSFPNNIQLELDYFYNRSAYSDYGFRNPYNYQTDESVYKEENRRQDLMAKVTFDSKWVINFHRGTQEKEWSDNAHTTIPTAKSQKHQARLGYEDEHSTIGLSINEHSVSSDSLYAKYLSHSVALDYALYLNEFTLHAQLPAHYIRRVADEIRLPFQVSGKWEKEKLAIRLAFQKRIPTVNEFFFRKDSTAINGFLAYYGAKMQENTALKDEHIGQLSLDYSYNSWLNTSIEAAYIDQQIGFSKRTMTHENMWNSQTVVGRLHGHYRFIENDTLAVFGYPLLKKVGLSTRYLAEGRIFSENSYAPAFRLSLDVISKFHLVGALNAELGWNFLILGERKALDYWRYTETFTVDHSSHLPTAFFNRFYAKLFIKSAIFKFEINRPFKQTHQIANGYMETPLGFHFLFGIDWSFYD